MLPLCRNRPAESVVKKIKSAIFRRAACLTVFGKTNAGHKAGMQSTQDLKGATSRDQFLLA
jgi:hypothetical protein